MQDLLKYSLILPAILCTLSAQAGDIARGKSKASACIGCHGTDGIGLSPEFPNLAGQKEAYLVKQLKLFKTGNRKDPTMNAMVAALNDQDMEDISAYFANLGAHTTTPSSTVAAATKTPNAKTTPQPPVTKKATLHEFPRPIYITMKKSGSVETFPQQITWEGGPNMLYNAVTPDGKRVLATSPSTNKVHVFSTKDGKTLAVISVGEAPKGVKIAPNGKRAYISNQGSAEISVISLEKLAVVNTIKVEEGPHNARFTKDGKLAYVTLQGGAGIAVIDTQTEKMIKVIPVAGITGPHNLDLSADEKTAFVRDFVHHVAILDLESGTVKKIITVGNGHGGIDVTPDGRFAVTAAIGDTFVSVINTKTLAVQNIEVGNGPHGVRASEDNKWLYVTLTKDDEIAVINTETMRVVKKIPVGQFPFWIAVKNNP